MNATDKKHQIVDGSGFSLGGFKGFTRNSEYKWFEDDTKYVNPIQALKEYAIYLLENPFDCMGEFLFSKDGVEIFVEKNGDNHKAVLQAYEENPPLIDYFNDFAYEKII